MASQSEETMLGCAFLLIVGVLGLTSFVLTYLNVYVYIALLLVLSFCLYESEDRRVHDIYKLMGASRQRVVELMGNPADWSRSLDANDEVVVFKYDQIRGGAVPAFRQKVTFTNGVVTAVSELSSQARWVPGRGCAAALIALYAVFCVKPISIWLENNSPQREKERNAAYIENNRRARKVKVKVGSHLEERVVSKKQITTRIAFAPDGSIIDEPVYHEERAQVSVDDFQEFTVGELEDAGCRLPDGTWKSPLPAKESQ